MPLIPPEATIRVCTCECGYSGRIPSHLRLSDDPGGAATFCDGTVTERVYVAVDREAWVERIRGALARERVTYPSRSVIGRFSLERFYARIARAVVDALLGPEDGR